ncbi:acyl-CoA dehydrogenase family protein [Paraburkholderia flagellata]|uniref:acyl-CoA dehydrogenase family protein n=1 Tax=Paraburkholderia flagellata TaxID=2883241 RepID=UPI001F3ADACB|nr:acyl-CoA dehydrogenase family protein [Paraburkholderia flagellata]
MDELISGAFERLLADHCNAAAVRAIEHDRGAQRVWQAFVESGFPDTVLASAHGGAGLALRDAYPLFEACGRYAVPLPFAETMALRAALAQAGGEAALAGVTGPLGIAPRAARSAEDIVLARVPHGLHCEWVALEHDGRPALWPTAEAEVSCTGIAGCRDATIRWHGVPRAARALPPLDWPTLGASLCAARMAGAMARVLELSLDHARQRVQFGRPIGKFQAMQQQISQLAERVAATRIAAQLALPAEGIAPRPDAAPMAKGYASEAAVLVCAVAHAVHGAIGITAEHDLSLFTRRLHEWRAHYGSESYWYERLGAAWIDMPEASQASALDYVRGQLSPSLA